MTGLALALLLVSASTPAGRSAPPQAVVSSLEQAAANAPRIYVGIYLSDVSGFDLREGRFNADLDLWMKWSGPPEPPVLRFVNGEIESREEQERESDGDWHSIRWRVQGTFRGTFPLHSFPFDRQQLKVELALPQDSAHLLPDLGSSGMAQQFSITGWEYQPFFRAESGKEVIASDLGSIRGEGQARVLESVNFVVDLSRPRTSNVLKFMLPLAIILAMAFLVFALPATQIDARGAMGVTALLSVVAFHFAMSGSLPDVPYLVAADRFFLASYVLVLLSIVETVVVFRLGEKRLARSRQVDRACAMALSAVALLVGASVITIPLAQADAELAGKRAPAPPLAPSGPPVASARDELRVGVTSLSSPSAQGLGALTRRGLSQLDADGTLQPHLALAIPAMTDESVRLLPDGGMLVRWRLRPHLAWSDGQPLTAADLVYSLGLISDPDRTEVTLLDPVTVQIRYRRRLAGALTDFPIYPEHVARPLTADGGMDALRGRDPAQPLPNDGPYRLVSFTAEKEAVYERNPHFAGTPPAIARVRVEVVPPEVLATRISEGTLDFVPALPGSVAEQVRAAPQGRVRFALDDTLLYLHPDLAVPQLADPRVRQALLHALDREAIARAYVEGAGRAAHTFRPDDAPDFAADARQREFSVEKARLLLAEVGALPTLPLLVIDLPGSGYAHAAQLIESQLRAVGIPVEVKKVPSSKAFQAVSRGGHGGLVLHTRRDERPARFFNLPNLSAGVLDTRTERPHFPARAVGLNQQFETSLFPERRRLLSMRLQREFAEVLPVLPVAFGAQLSGYTGALQGFEGAGQSGSVWWNVERWTLAPASAPRPEPVVGPIGD